MLVNSQSKHTVEIRDGGARGEDWWVEWQADYKVINPAPQTLENEDAAKLVGTHGQENTWMPIGKGKHVLVYTTWANATGWRKVPAIYTKAPGGIYQLAAWNEEGFDFNRMRDEANAEAMRWTLTQA